MKGGRGFNIFLLILLTAEAFSQSASGEYVVITVEDHYESSQHGTRTYYWIVPADSITSVNSTLSRLFVSDFSVDNLQNCCSGIPMDPVVVTEASNFKLDNDYLSTLQNLRKLISQHRRKIQQITKKWESSGQRQTVQVFATAIAGEFCLCDYHPIGQQRTGYKGKVCVPKSSFSNNEKFWDSPNANFILKRDFSTVDFDIIPN